MLNNYFFNCLSSLWDSKAYEGGDSSIFLILFSESSSQYIEDTEWIFLKWNESKFKT